MSVYEKLKALNITLPAVATPAAALCDARTNWQYLFSFLAISPKKTAKVWVGKLGQDMQTAEGKEAARLIAIDLIATLQDHAVAI